MKTSRHLYPATLLAGLAAALPLTAATLVWNGTTGNWSSGANWDLGTAPGAGDSAHIEGGSADRTVTYDSAASGLLDTLILDQAALGFTNTLLISKTGSAAAPSLTLANDLALGGDSGLGTVRLQLGSGSYLKIGSAATGTLTLGQNAVLLAAGSSSSPTIDAHVTLNAGGLITLNSTSNPDTRTTILGNFTANGGTIERVAGSAGQGILQLKGATNILNDVTFSGAPFIYLNGAGDQSFLTDVTVANLAFRAATGVKTLSGTGTIGTLHIGNYASGNTLTFNLGSDLASTNGFANGGWGGAAGATLALETNGHDFTVTNTLGFVTGNAASVTWNISNSQSTASTVSANIINFDSGSTYTISGPLTLEARTGAINFNSAAIAVGDAVTLKSSSAFDLTAATAGNVTLASGATLHHTGAGTSNLGSRSGLRYRYTGSGGGLQSTGSLASIEIGDGVTSSTLTRFTSNLTGLSGDLRINRHATYASGGWGTTLAGSASITGNGTYKAINTTGSVTWSAGSTGGLSAGDADGGIGTLTFSAGGTVTGIPSITLLATSVSTFDIAGDSSHDVVHLGAFNITFNGTLYLNFLGAYAPEDGATFALFQSASELNSASVAFTGAKSGDFTSIASNLTGYGFAFDAASGLLTVTAVPEPSALAALAGLAALAATLACRRRRPGR